MSAAEDQHAWMRSTTPFGVLGLIDGRLQRLQELRVFAYGERCRGKEDSGPCSAARGPGNSKGELQGEISG